MMAKACRDNMGYTIVSLADPLKNITREILNISAEELVEMKDNGTTFDPPYKQTADVLSEALPFKRDEITRLLSDKPLYAEGYYLVIGLLDSTPAEEAAFEAAFGDHYLNARAFLNQLGLSNEGLKPEDRTAVENGEVPLYLRDKYDAARAPFYLNRDGYAAIGREAFRMIDATGYFDAIRGVIAEAMAEAAAINN